MKFTEALKVIYQGPADGSPFAVNLACGFTPLHLATFLHAYLQRALPLRCVKIGLGTYGDLAGALESWVRADSEATAIAIEWPDLDSRLGYRQLGGWGPDQAADTPKTVRFSLDRIARAILALPASNLVAVSLPTMPPAPLFHTPGWQASAIELSLMASLFEFAAAISARPNTYVLNPNRLAAESNPCSRFDLRAELFGNLPYDLTHADAVGAGLARLIQPPAPKKGLITDLDDTLWHGILGDVGPDGISWDLASHHSLHGIYQQQLAALADEGVLVAVASKNDLAAVEHVFGRNGLLLPAGKVFPLEVHWSAKSGSVDKILRTWNISADSVVFVDDSPMEIAEVKQAHPEMECILFPKADYAGALEFFHRIRDLFGKSRVSDEDRLRLESIRQGAELRQLLDEGRGASDEFLQSMNGVVTVEFQNTSRDPRVLELVNKTNQFNLNGRRFTQADWDRQMTVPGAFVMAISYADKFGSLGKISVLKGSWSENTAKVDSWVLSCRAFARRIEHQTVRVLLDHLPAAQIRFALEPTPKNGPLQDFFSGLLGDRPQEPVTLSRALFDEKCPPLYHTVKVTGMQESDVLKLIPEEVHG